MKYLVRFSYCFACFFYLFSCKIYAADFNLFLPCEGNGISCYPYIFIQGDITKDTPDEFDIFLKNEYYSQYGGKPKILFDSDGGDLYAGIELGKRIRKKQLKTHIGLVENVIFDTDIRYETIVEESKCYSACVYAFIGGIERTIDFDHSSFGVHQFYSKGGSEKKAQVIISDLIIHIEKMGVDKKLLGYASATDTDKMFILNEKHIVELNIDNTRSKNTPWQLDAYQDGRLFLCSSSTNSFDIKSRWVSENTEPLLKSNFSNV